METPQPEVGAAQTFDDFRQRLADLGTAPGVATDALIFTDLDRPKLAEARRAWPKLPVELRRRLVAQMVELAEEQIEYNFNRILKVALRDDDPQVRAGAITGLWEDDGEDVLAYLLENAIHDPDLAVRKAAAKALARFSQLVAEEAIGERWGAPLRDQLLALVRGRDSLEVRRRALEALALYADDAEVTGEIERAYHSDDESVRMSALYAMGQNADERWLDTVLNEMDSRSPGLRYEATRASGEFADRRAVPLLIERLGDDDREVQLAAVGSLGRIGGTASINILKRLASSSDDVVREAAEEALDEASFQSNPIGPGSRLRLGDGPS